MMDMRDRNGLTEEEFLKQYDPNRYKRPALTADTCIVAHDGDKEEVLLIKRGGHPFLGRWAFPGGFINEGERIEETAARELYEETGLEHVPLTLVGVYSKPGRDPRGWNVTVGYRGDVLKKDVDPHAGDDAKEAKWFEIIRDQGTLSLVHGDLILHVIPDGHELAFDHSDFAKDALGEER